MTTSLSEEAQAFGKTSVDEKPAYAQKVRKKESEMIANIDTLKEELAIKEKELAILKATREAKKAAMIAAEKAVESTLGDKKRAHSMALSIVKHKKVHKKSVNNTKQIQAVDLRKRMLLGLAKNRAVQSATQAATEKAMEILKDKDLALEVVTSLRLNGSPKKSNPKGESIVKADSSTSSKIVTLRDIKKANKKRVNVPSKAISHSEENKHSHTEHYTDENKEDKHNSTADKVKTAIELGGKTLDIGLKVGKTIGELLLK